MLIFNIIKQKLIKWNVLYKNTFFKLKRNVLDKLQNKYVINYCFIFIFFIYKWIPKFVNQRIIQVEWPNVYFDVTFTFDVNLIRGKLLCHSSVSSSSCRLITPHNNIKNVLVIKKNQFLTPQHKKDLRISCG